MAKLQELKNYLKPIPPGKIVDEQGDLESLIAACWDQFSGASAERMDASKLSGRMEEIFWDPPELNFTIERHGATVLGSSRAELQSWSLDIEACSAKCGQAGYRQLKPRRPRLNVAPLAEEIVGLIVKRRKDDRLKWNADGSVRVLIGEVIPGGFAAPQQTVAGRRRRFRAKMEQLLATQGWHTVRPNVYAPNIR